MKFWRGNYEDISKYYVHTLVKFDGFVAEYEGEPWPAGERIHIINRVSPDCIQGKVLLEDNKQEDFRFYLSQDEAEAPDVEILFPKKSYFNTNDGAKFLYRIPARQWKKGITQHNTCVSYLDSTGNFVDLTLDGYLLGEYTRKPAFTGFHVSEKSYAVSRRMAVSGVKLFLDRTRVGHVDIAGKTIKLTHSMFIPEVTRVLREHSQDFKIDVATSHKKAKRKVGDLAVSGSGELVVNEE